MAPFGLAEARRARPSRAHVWTLRTRARGVCVDDGAQGVEEVRIKEDPRSEASYPPSQSMSTSNDCERLGKEREWERGNIGSM